MTVALRPMAPSDIPVCAAMVDAERLFDRYGFTSAAAARALQGALAQAAACLTVAELDGNPAGFTWFVPRGAFDRSGYLRLLVVDPSRRRAGVAARLLADLDERFLVPHGIVLLVAEGNDAARRLYTSAGYRAAGRLPDYVAPGLHEHILFKPAPLPSGS